MDIQAIFRKAINPWLPYLFCFTGAWFFYTSSLLFLDSILDFDIYFHIAIAREYWENGLIQAIPWVQDSIWKNGFYDTHFLYHILLIPIAIQWVSIPLWIGFFCALSLVSYLYFVQPGSPREWILYSCLFGLGSYIFTGRLLFGKGLVVFLPILFLFLKAWKKSSPISVFLYAWTAVWLYPLAIALPLIATVSTFWVGFALKDWKETQLLLWTFLGFFLGIAIHPSHPYQWNGFWFEWAGQIFPPRELESIAEWNPPGSILYVSTLYLILTLVGLFRKHIPNNVLILFGLGILSTWFTTKSLEWTIPMGLVGIASARTEISNLVYRNRYGFLLWFFLIGNLIVLLRVAVEHSQARGRLDSRTQAIKICSELPTETRVWILWDDFPHFSLECPQGVYPFGMNPLYSYAHDRNRYSLIRTYWDEQSSRLTDLPAFLGYNTILLNSHRDSIELIGSYERSLDWQLDYREEPFFIFRYRKAPANASEK